MVNGTPIKSAIAYKLNDVRGATNGALEGADVAVTMPTVTKLEIGCLANVFQWGGGIRVLDYYGAWVPSNTIVTLTA